MPQISVIVPVYRTEKYLEECILSILTQTFDDLEIILVDDGSYDSCSSICDQYAIQDHRIKVIHKNNAGVAAARNTGLSIAIGEYITFVDSDDWIEPAMYSQMMGKANQYDGDVVMCDCLKDSGQSSLLYSHDIRSGFYNKEMLITEYYPHLLMMENIEYPPTISNCLCLFKKGISSKYVEGIKYSEDLLFGAQLLKKANSFYYLKNYAPYHYRMHNESASHTFDSYKWRNYKELYIVTQEWLKSVCEYDFSFQLDWMLLFFLYNTISELRHSSLLTANEKRKEYRRIVNDDLVISLFKKIDIWKLQIPAKQKILTLMYKYKIYPM